jgi:hypothetical protein
MKTRLSFVSNSSSSSFLIKNKTENEINDFIQKIAEAYEALGIHIGNIEDALYCYHVDDLDEYRLKFFNGYNKNKLTLEQFKRMNNSLESVSGTIVDSCNENSIPWVIQNVLSDLGERVHWS